MSNSHDDAFIRAAQGWINYTGTGKDNTDMRSLEEIQRVNGTPAGSSRYSVETAWGGARITRPSERCAEPGCTAPEDPKSNIHTPAMDCFLGELCESPERHHPYARPLTVADRLEQVRKDMSLVIAEAFAETHSVMSDEYRTASRLYFRIMDALKVAQDLERAKKAGAL